MAVMFSALRIGQPLTPNKISGTYSCYSRANSKAIVQLEGLGKLDKSIQ
jgi:hypothetical protein